MFFKKLIDMRTKIEIPERYKNLRFEVGVIVSPSKLMTLWKTQVSPKNISFINRLYSFSDGMFHSGQFSIPIESVLNTIEKSFNMDKKEGDE